MAARRLGLYGVIVGMAAIAGLIWLGRTLGSDDDEPSRTTQLAREPDVDSGSLDSGATSTADPPSAAEFVGRVACAGCHPVQTERWLGSHHDLAMQEATEKTVLADFDDTAFTHFDETSTFSTQDGKFFVRTDGPDGQPTDYQVRYTFGVTPLQQYLIEFPGGRLQPLSVSWDTRPAEDGGQRWIHLYPNEAIPHDDPLHWTGANQNWNFTCAECHSTNLRKNYNPQTNSYDTTWSEINVSCEACHGPGSEHVAWANAVTTGDAPPDGPRRLAVQLKDPGSATFVIDMETGNAKRAEPYRTGPQIETCARCHARRSAISENYTYGRPLMDTHRPALLDERLYYVDGQIRDEVYVYGSFLQSKMYHAGVTCSDCHDAHSSELRGEGNALCYPCHNALKFDTPAHHHHESGTPGASCVECHMPETTYMVVDPRRDHSMRVPRPDLSVALGTPNACNRCHTDQTPEWAANATEQWYGSERAARPHYGQVLAVGQTGAPGAEAALVGLIRDAAEPGIARATALTLLNGVAGPASLSILPAALADADPLVRHSALTALEMLRPDQLVGVAFPLLADPIRAVRMEAVRVLARATVDLPPQQQDAVRNAMREAIDEYVAATLTDAERPSAQLNLGVFLADLGRVAEAEAAYRTALRLDPSDARVYVNLSDLYRARGRENLCEQTLREALTIVPSAAAVHHSLGLSLARQRRIDDAIESLAVAVRLEPDAARFRYAHAIALNEQEGKTDEALGELTIAHQRHPYDRDILIALATIHGDNGSLDLAIEHARKLLELAPENVGYQQLWMDFERLKNER